MASKRDELNPFKANENGWGFETWNEGWDACDREHIRRRQAEAFEGEIDGLNEQLDFLQQERDRLRSAFEELSRLGWKATCAWYEAYSYLGNHAKSEICNEYTKHFSVADYHKSHAIFMHNNADKIIEALEAKVE